MSLSSLLIHTVNVETQSQGTKTPTGGATNNLYTLRTPGVRCRVEQLSGDAEVTYGRLGDKVTDIVFFDSDPSLSVKERLVWGTDYLYVKRCNPVYAQGSTPHHWEVQAERKAL